MSSPKHLWSGDWEQESAAAAEALANRQVRTWPTAPEPERPTRPPSPPRQPRRRERSRPRIPLPRPRIALLSAVALLLLAGAAYGLTSLNGPTRSAATHTPWLGARLQSWPAGGALVAHVASGGPAASAGLRSGDIIIQVQGRPVSAPFNVTAAVGALNVGDKLQMLVVRGGRTLPTIATLGARPIDVP